VGGEQRSITLAHEVPNIILSLYYSYSFTVQSCLPTPHSIYLCCLFLCCVCGYYNHKLEGLVGKIYWEVSILSCSLSEQLTLGKGR